MKTWVKILVVVGVMFVLQGSARALSCGGPGGWTYPAWQLSSVSGGRGTPSSGPVYVSNNSVIIVTFEILDSANQFCLFPSFGVSGPFVLDDSPVPGFVCHTGITFNSGWCNIGVRYIGPGLLYTSASGTLTLGSDYGYGDCCPYSVGLVVAATPPTRIDITPANTSLYVGQVQQFSALGNYFDGSTYDLTSVATWSISGSSATVSASGLVTSNSVGSATITASYAGTSGLTTLTVSTFHAGRWTFEVLSGDTAATLAWGSTEFILWLNQNSSNGIDNDPEAQYTSNNANFIATGSDILVSSSDGSQVTPDGHATIKATVTNVDGTFFSYTFSGQLNSGTQIQGSYTVSTSAGYSSPYLPNNTGSQTFIATWLPNLDDGGNYTYVGTLSAPLSNITGQARTGADDIGATLQIFSSGQSGKDSIYGTVTINETDLPRFVSGGGASCLTPFKNSDGSNAETLRFDDLGNDSGGWLSEQSGYVVEIFARDGAGVNVFLEGESMGDPNGTNGPIQDDDKPCVLVDFSCAEPTTSGGGITFPAVPGNFRRYWDNTYSYFSGGIYEGQNRNLYFNYYVLNGVCANYLGVDGPFRHLINGVVPKWNQDTTKHNSDSHSSGSNSHGKHKGLFERRWQQILKQQ